MNTDQRTELLNRVYAKIGRINDYYYKYLYTVTLHYTHDIFWLKSTALRVYIENEWHRLTKREK